MRTLILNGSPRENGDTAHLIRELAVHLDGEVNVVNAYDAAIRPCVDCRHCFENNGCIIDDDMQRVYGFIQEADNILLASPIYFSELTGALLNLCSRLQVYYAAKFVRKQPSLFKTKKGGLLVAAGGSSKDYTKAESTARLLFHAMNGGEWVGTAAAMHTDKTPACEDAQALQAVRDLAGRMNHQSNGDILSAQSILSFLPAGAYDGKIVVYNCLESTNKTAKEIVLSMEAEHGTVIIADSQTAGRGRYGRAFFSPRGSGLYMSLILRPARLGFESPTAVTAFAAVSVCEAIESLPAAKPPQVKWVNDVFLDGKKVCGILTEAVSGGQNEGSQWIVLGIGVNFTLPMTGFPKSIENVAGAIFTTENPTTTRSRLAAEIISRIMAPARKTQAEMFEAYRKRLMLLGQTVTVSGLEIEIDEAFEAVALDVDMSGRLIVKKENGDILALSSGDVRVCPSP